ncbi:MAG: TonB family protein [Gammaproteobacteria bacterium]
MSAAAAAAPVQPPWAVAAATALLAHGMFCALLLLWSRPAEVVVPEPVVLVNLPPADEPAPALSIPRLAVAPLPIRIPLPALDPVIDAPPVTAPLPRDPVTLPPHPPVEQPVQQAQEPAAESAPAPRQPADAPADRDASAADPKAQRQAADYFARLSAHLNRRKSYPPSAKKARQQGVVTVRFTVDRDGNVSEVSIKASSGHAILDQATLELLQRVAPLPRMPDSMQRDRITLSLPIDYSLRTS